MIQSLVFFRNLGPETEADMYFIQALCNSIVYLHAHALDITYLYCPLSTNREASTDTLTIILIRHARELAVT